MLNARKPASTIPRGDGDRNWLDANTISSPEPDHARRDGRVVRHRKRAAVVLTAASAPGPYSCATAILALATVAEFERMKSALLAVALAAARDDEGRHGGAAAHVLGRRPRVGGRGRRAENSRARSRRAPGAVQGRPDAVRPGRADHAGATDGRSAGDRVPVSREHVLAAERSRGPRAVPGARRRHHARSRSRCAATSRSTAADGIW